MPIKLESKKQYKYDDKYAKFLGYALGGEEFGKEYAQLFAREVDLLQESAFKLRNNFSEIEATKKTHVNHKAAFEHLTQAYQYQLDSLEELTHHIITKAPLVDATKKAHLLRQIERAQIFTALQETHFALETEYAALKDNIKQTDKDKQKQKVLEAEFKSKEPVVKQLRETISELNKKFKEFENADDKKVEKLSRELDLVIEKYNQQKSEYDKLVQQPIVTPDSSKLVEKELQDKKDKKDKKDKQDKKDKKDKKPEDSSELNSSKKSKKENKIIGALSFVGDGVKRAGSTVLAAPATIVGATKKAGSAVIVKPGQHIVKSFSVILVQNNQPLDRNVSVSEPNRTKEYDQILLNDKSLIDIKYKKALEDKITELETPNDVFTKDEKSLAEKLLASARNLIAKINSHKEDNNIEMTVKAEKELFLKDLRALLFPQLKANNRQALKLQMEDLKTQKRLINKMTSKNDELPKNKYFLVIDECITAIKKARKKIKETKSYNEMMQFMLPLAAYNENCKAAKGEFNKYLTENTASQNSVSKSIDGQASPDTSSESSSPASGSTLSARSSMGDLSDERTGDSADSLTGSAISSRSTPRSPSPTSSHSYFSTPRSSSDHANEDESEVVKDEGEAAKLTAIEAEKNAKLAELDAEKLALKLREAEILEQIKLFEESEQLNAIKRLEQELSTLNERTKQQESINIALIQASEDRTAQLEKNINEWRKREATEIASRKAQLEKEERENLEGKQKLQKEIAAIANEKAEIAKELSDIAAQLSDAEKQRNEYEKEAARLKALFSAEAEKHVAERKAAELEFKRNTEALEKLAREKKQAEERITEEEKQKGQEARLVKEAEEKSVRVEQSQRDAEDKTRKERLERWGVTSVAGTNNSSSTAKADYASQNMPANNSASLVEPAGQVANSNQVKPSSKQPFLVGKEQIEFTVAKMQEARTKIQEFMAKLLKEDDDQKKSWWPFYFKDTKLTKRAELQRLCEVIKANNDDNAWDFYEAVKKARKDGGTLTQSIKSDRTRTLLDNILECHPELGTEHPTKEQRAEQKARIASLRKSSPGKRR